MSLSCNYPVTRTSSSCMLSWCFYLIVLGILRVSSNESESNALVDFDKYANNCSSTSLEEREERANIIFTGTVQEVLPHRKHFGQTKAHVEVKRVLKGRLVEGGGISGDPRTVVSVDGLDNPEICHSSVKLFDTRIFLVNENGNELRLSSSLLRMTLNNLEHVEAAVRNEKFIRKPEDPEDPCARVFCPYHAECTLNASLGRPYCSCPKQCHGVFTPVCGSDNVTYTSECHLRMASCQKGKRIQARRPGHCSDPDVCTDTVCGFGAFCVLSADNTGARCRCPHSCSSRSDGNVTICGSDGRDYGNMCEMERASCTQMQNISKTYDGKCDPCHGFACKSGVCQVNANREPVCRCAEYVCTEEDPLGFVCASDGVTYDSECAMKKQSCMSRKKISKVFAGKCQLGFDACRNVKCSPHAECLVNNGKPECVCPGNCQPVFRPVCGNDRKTYENECQLHRHSCTSGIPIAVLDEGFCPQMSPCSQLRCRDGSICSVINGQPSCVCPTCAQEFNPVCGSNGISYSSECMLRAESCQRKEYIEVEHEGLCSTCQETCNVYSECQLDIHNVSQCICPTFCVKVENPVCGADGVTYTNECELRIASCSTKKLIEISSQGSCDMCANVKCRRGAMCENGKCVCPHRCPATSAPPVCASNGVTYASECIMRQTGCQLTMDLEVVEIGECDDQSGSGSGSDDGCESSSCQFGGSCTIGSSGLQECYCNFTCPALRQTVCGSDGRTYGSECLMKEMSCKLQKVIIEQSADNCEDIVEEMCEGTAPLIDPVTDRDYNCTDDLGVCPAGSYCHKTTLGAKCCREDMPVSSCFDTVFGCCADNTTVAPGPHKAGCPGFCKCNPLGSLSSTCDPVSRQCTCKPGVGGLRCDRCHPNHWRLPNKKENVGCLPCDCSPFGSVRDDCDQRTGRCLCRHDYDGPKCSVCTNGQTLGPHGCSNESNISLSSCAHVNCTHGAVCETQNGLPKCICPFVCPHHVLDDPSQSVCGSDGQTYGSSCQLESFACRAQQNISVAFHGHCSSGEMQELADEEEDFGSIGDLCSYDIDCLIANSVCYHGLCMCRTGFAPSDSKPFCQVETTMESAFIRMHSRDPPMPSDLSTAFHIRLLTTSLQRDDSTSLSTPTLQSEHKGTSSTATLQREDSTSSAITLQSEHSTPHTPTRRRKHSVPPTTTLHREHSTLPSTTILERERSTPPSATTLLRVDSTSLATTLQREDSTPLPAITLLREDSTSLATTLQREDSSSATATLQREDITPPPATTLQRELDWTTLTYEGNADTSSSLVSKGGASFMEKSYLQLNWSVGGNPNMSVDVTFIPQSPDGIIFYTGQLDKPRGDFVSLALRDGLVEFRYDLKSGPAILTSAEKVKMNEMNRILGQRSSKDGSLKLNDFPEVFGTSQGTHTMLNLDNSATYLGSVPATKDVLLKHIGMEVGFIGCVASLKVSDAINASKLYDLTYLESSDVVRGSLSGRDCSSFLKPDESPCEPNPCESQGTCERLPTDNYTCICPKGKAGQRCERVSPVSFNGFNHHAYDNAITKPQYAQLSNKYEVVFRTDADRGLLLLLHNGSSVKADYLAIAINKGQVEASLNLGSEKSIDLFIIRSAKQIHDNQWHTVLFSRNMTDVQLSVDDEVPVTNVSSPGSNQLNTDGKLWIGGKAIRLYGLPKPYLRGFSGCISSIKIDDRSLHLVDDRKTNNRLAFCEDP